MKQRTLYARIEIPWGEIIAERAKRENYELALRARLGMNSKQVARVMRRYPGSFVKARRHEMQALINDFARAREAAFWEHAFTIPAPVPWWRRLRLCAEWWLLRRAS